VRIDCKPRMSGAHRHSNTVPGIDGWIPDQGMIERRYSVGLQRHHSALFPQGGCGPAGLGTIVRCFGENAATKHSPCTREARFAPLRNTRGRAMALFSSELRIWAGRPAQEGRNSSGAGAPPQTALACAAGPFVEVAPGTFPCRKARLPRMAAKASAVGIPTVIHRSPGVRSESKSRA